jgi:hypothetical protein
MIISIEDFKKVIEGELSLTMMGVNSLYAIKKSMNIPHAEAKERLKRERESFLLHHFDEFKICCDWLDKFKKVKTPQFSSYYLKHVVEKLSGESISNGGLIAAALHLGLPTKSYPGSPNINIAISKKCPYLKKAGNVA